MNKLLSILFVLFISAIGFGQGSRELIKLGDQAMENGQYSNAVHYYSYVLHKIESDKEAIYYPYEIAKPYEEPEKTEDGKVKPPESPTEKEVIIVHKLADAYRLADDYTHAEIWYEAAVQNPQEEFPYARYFYAVSLMYNSKFEEAIVQFEKFMTEDDPNPDSKFYKLSEGKIASCQFALNPENTKNKITITDVDSLINEGSTSFGLTFVSDNVVLFSSARVDNSTPDSLRTGDSNPLELYMLDIYIVTINEDGTWNAPEKFPFEINSEEFHEGSCVISADGNSLFFTKMDPHHRNNTKIYASRKFNNQWLKPFPLDQNVNMDGFRSMNPCISKDGTTLYYSSNRPGGEGGMDIWMVSIDANGNTSEPVNMGSMINTADDEITPFIHEGSQTLYFASAGHIGFGGLDIYYAKWNPDSEWYNQAQNAGAPINSARDDSYFFIDESLVTGFVTSDRQACTECDSLYYLSIHCNKIYQINKPELKFKISGYVYDIATNEIIPGAKIDFKDVSYKWDHFELIADENGYYEHDIIPNLELFMKATKTDYFADQSLVITKGQTESKNYRQDFYLEKIPKGEITIEGIEYDYNKATLRPISKERLDELIKFLELNSNLKIEIRSHTDFRGSDPYNLDLSDRRAKSVVDYLIENGIPRERLVPKGYGESMPAEIEINGEMVTLTEEFIKSVPDEILQEEYHQRNRRTAFFVLEQN